MFKKLFIALLAFSAISCSQFSHSLTSKTWHNLNARYNASVDAQAYYQYGLFKIDSSQVDDFGSTLPILPQIDSNETAISKPELDEVIRLTSLVAEKHSNSRHLDQAYLLLGKARLYEEDFMNAIEVFKYLNSNHKKESSKSAALIWLMRAYMENNDLDKASAVANEINNLTLSNANKADYLQIRAAFHQRNNEPTLAVAFLEEALKYMKKTPNKARAYFIVGQLYDQLERGSLARENWLKVLKNKPRYEVEFNTQMELLMLSNNLGGNATGAFQKMLSDRKNSDLKDKIHYKMGMVKLENHDYRAAINEFSNSIQLAKDKTQKANAYLNIAEIYYDKLQDYEMASSYYDSTLQNINVRSVNYEEIKNKANSLADFVKYHKVIRTEDSLQRLAAMNPQALEEQIESALKKEEENKKRQEEEAAKTETKNVASDPSKWFFYDQVQLTRSRAAFIRNWGNRPLEDNWRRKNKEIGSLSFQIEKGITGVDDVVATEDEQKEKDEAKRLAEFEAEKQAMLKQVPTTPAQMAASKRKQEEAYYELGKIYRFQFKENENAKKTFSTLLEKFPETQYEQEVLYFMALLAEDQNNNTYRVKLIDKFPLSSYARKLKRGNVEITADTESKAQRDYAELFNAYKNGNYNRILAQVEKALNSYTGTSVEDKLAMLRIMILAKNRDDSAYRTALMDFVRSYPSSDLKPRVSKMLAAITDKK